MYSVIPVPPDQAIVLPLRSRIALRVALDLRTREDALSLRGARCYLFPMSTLAEIEKSVSQFSAEELAELEQIIRKARRAKEQVQKSSLRDANPVSVGKILKPIGTRDEWYSEMLEGRV